MRDTFEQILNQIPDYRKAAQDVKESLLAHLVVLEGIPDGRMVGRRRCR